MFAKAFSMIEGNDNDVVITRFVERSKYAPLPGGKRLKITFTHEDSRDASISKLERDKGKYKDKKVIFLARDPRDIMVSAYFEMTRRKGLNFPDISTFIRDEVYGIDKLIAYMNIWAENRHVPADFLLVRYEDMQADTCLQLRRVLEFIGLPNISDEIVHKAVEFARFERMKKLETSMVVNTSELLPGDLNDPESFKVRRGKVGGYKDYLDHNDIEYLNERIRRNLSDYFGSYKN